MKKILLFILSILFIFGVKADLPHIVIICTGGTIAEKTDLKSKSSVPALNGEEIVESVPYLKKLATYKIVDFSRIDSSQMTPKMWADLSRTVDLELLDPMTIGAIVTHGTDTMAEGAFFLEITLKTKKPVVFVGAMRNATDPYSDGPPNLLNAVFQILSDKSGSWGVTVTMNQYINAARDVEKIQTTNVQTFESGEKGYLGYINDGIVYKFNEVLHKIKLPIPKELAKVELFTDYAGADGGMLRYAVDHGAEAIVIESFGSGNVNADLFEAIKYARSKNVIIVITSRVFYGGVFPEYGDKGGGKSLKEIGAIVCGNLRGPKARLLLMLLLPFEGKDPQKLEKYFQIP